MTHLKALLAAAAVALGTSASAATVTYQFEATANHVISSASGVAIGDTVSGRITLDTSATSVYAGFGVQNYVGTPVVAFSSSLSGDMAIGTGSTVTVSNNASYTSCGRRGCNTSFWDGWGIIARETGSTTNYVQFSLLDTIHPGDAVTSRLIEDGIDFSATNRRLLTFRTSLESVDASVTRFDPVLPSVPLPASALLLAGGLAGFAALGRRARRRAA